MTTIASVVLFAAAVMAAVFVSTPDAAFAHSRLLSSEPAASATVTVAPTEVSLGFNEPIRTKPNSVSVTAPDGSQSGTNSPRSVDNVVSQTLIALTVPGEYKVAYNVLSADGHEITGSFSFQFAPAQQQAETTTTIPPAQTSTTAQIVLAPAPQAKTGDSESDGPPLVAITAALVLVSSPAALMLLRRKRHN